MGCDILVLKKEMRGRVFDGGSVGSMVIDLNGQDVEGATFRGVTLTGSPGEGSVSIYDSVIDRVDGLLVGTVSRCTIIATNESLKAFCGDGSLIVPVHTRDHGGEQQWLGGGLWWATHPEGSGKRSMIIDNHAVSSEVVAKWCEKEGARTPERYHLTVSAELSWWS